MQVEVNPCPNACMGIYRVTAETSILNWRVLSPLVVVFTWLFTASEEDNTGISVQEGTLKQDFCRNVQASRSCWGG